MNTLRNITLNVAIEYTLPYCGFNSLGKVDVSPDQLEFSIELELLKLLMQRYGFRVNLKNGFFQLGSKVNESWTGTIGKVLNGTLDLAMCAYDLSRKGNFDVVRFTRPFLFDELAFMSLVPKHRQRTWIILEPFKASVWLATLIAGLTSVIFLKSSNIFGLFAVLLNRSIRLEKLRLRYEFLLIGWILASLVLANSYLGVFHSILTFPDYEQAVETKDDLIEYLKINNSATKLMIDHDYFADILESCEKENEIYSLIKSFKTTKFPIEEVIANFERANRERFHRQAIFIDHRLFIMWLRRKAWNLDRNLYLSSDRLKTISIGWILPPKSPLLVPFNRILVRVFEMGIIRHWTDVTFTTFPARDRSLAYDRTSFQKEAGFRAFQLEDFRSIFIVWANSLAVSMIAFVLELVTFWVKHVKPGDE